jgi:oligopeptide/dipeptide ABC transporter ATP-binding protein
MASRGIPLLEVSGLTVEFGRGRNVPPLRAVDDVSFAIGERETLSLVGESGSGKTTIARAILGLASTKAGTISFNGHEITNLPYRQRRRLSVDLQAVFQDPYSSLNPTRTIEQTLGEALRPLGTLSRAEVRTRAASMLDRVGLGPEALRRHPSAFSGGQRQRIAIARALMVEPKLVVCDEPTSALDLSVQAQVLNLLQDLQDDLALSYLFISHDLEVVRHLSRRIIVLYRGRVMEQGEARTLHENPTHPYTRALLDAAPVPDPEVQRHRRMARAQARSVEAGFASTSEAESCPFTSRCPNATSICESKKPLLETTPDGVLLACHHWRELWRGKQASSAGTALASRS